MDRATSLQQYVAAVLGGLLASSCCVVQLVLNLFSIGCAGLNTMLEPYRALFLMLALGGLVYSFCTDVLPCLRGSSRCTATQKRDKKRRFCITATIVIVLSFSPELLATINNHADLVLAPIHQSFSSGSCDPLAAGDPAVRIDLRVDGMHCQACKNRAINALLQLHPCAKVQLEVQSGEGRLIVSEHASKDITDRHIEQAIAEATFTAHVLHREHIIYTPTL